MDSELEQKKAEDSAVPLLKKKISKRSDKKKIDAALKRCLDIFGEIGLNAVEGNLVATCIEEISSRVLKKSQLLGKPEEFAVLEAEIANMAKRKVEKRMKNEKTEEGRKGVIDPESGEELDIVSAKPLPKNCPMYR